jgi:hypothetical protein
MNPRAGLAIFRAAHWLDDEEWRGHGWNDRQDMLPDYLSKL